MREPRQCARRITNVTECSCMQKTITGNIARAHRARPSPTAGEAAAALSTASDSDPAAAFPCPARPWQRRAAAGLAAGLVACSPTLDWRTVEVDATDLQAAFPCQPSRFERPVQVAGRPLALFLLSCEAGDATYGLATAEVDDPARVDDVLAALAAAARQGIGAGAAASSPFAPAGTTPYRGNVSLLLTGRRPGGGPVQEALSVFARGTRVFQATVIATRLDEPAVAPFRDGLRFSVPR